MKSIVQCCLVLALTVVCAQPTLAHWGAYSPLVYSGQSTYCEHAIPGAVRRGKLTWTSFPTLEAVEGFQNGSIVTRYRRVDIDQVVIKNISPSGTIDASVLYGYPEIAGDFIPFLVVNYENIPLNGTRTTTIAKSSAGNYAACAIRE